MAGSEQAVTTKNVHMNATGANARRTSEQVMNASPCYLLCAPSGSAQCSRPDYSGDFGGDGRESLGVVLSDSFAAPDNSERRKLMF